MLSMETCVASLRTELDGADYCADTRLGGTRAQLRFIGRFQGEEIVWDAELIALAATDASAPQFLEIAGPTARGIRIRIGLGVACIDRPTVMKAIIMVRNYKLLHLGRHEFGPHGPVASVRADSGMGE